MSIRKTSELSGMPLWMVYTYYYVFRGAQAKNLCVSKSGKGEIQITVDYDANSQSSKMWRKLYSIMTLQEFLDSLQ